MTTTDYIVNIALVLIVIRQIRGGKLDLTSMVLPVVLVAGSAAYYLHTVPTAGHDLILTIGLGLVGATLGSLAAVATSVIKDHDGVVMAKAGAVAATLWIVGIGTRMTFAFLSDHGAEHAIANFSRAHQITGGDAWTAAFVVMALAEAISRTAVLQIRAYALRSPVVAPAEIRVGALV
jgi:hypothetical protein